MIFAESRRILRVMESTFDRTLSPSASILLVEDDVAVARVLTVLLTKAGYRVTAFATAELALVALAHGEVDVVLSDLRLPAMSGFDLLGRVVTATPELPVVLITAQGSVALAVEAMRAGASDFLLKPFERDELLFVVRKALLRGAADARPPAASLPESGIVGDSAAMEIGRAHV